MYIIYVSVEFGMAGHERIAFSAEVSLGAMGQPKYRIAGLSNYSSSTTLLYF